MPLQGQIESHPPDLAGGSCIESLLQRGDLIARLSELHAYKLWTRPLPAHRRAKGYRLRDLTDLQRLSLSDSPCEDAISSLDDVPFVIEAPKKLKDGPHAFYHYE